MSREKKKDCMNCLHYDMMEGKKIIQRMFILHRLRKENNMRKNIQVKVKVPQFTVITGLMYAQRDSWFGHTMQDLKMDLIYPEDKERKYPCIVWICGGADSYYFVLSRFGTKAKRTKRICGNGMDTKS